jgi:replicative DNA helicase
MIISSEERDNICVQLATSSEVFVITDRELDVPHIQFRDKYDIAHFESILNDSPPAYPLILAFFDEELGKLVEDNLQLRGMQYVATKYSELNYVEAREHILSYIPAEKKLQDISLGHKVMEKLKFIEKGGEMTSTGFRNFDKLIGGGLNNGRLYVLGAIPSLGKSTFCVNIADNLVSRKVDVLMFSLEMSRMELLVKVLVRRSLRIAKGDVKLTPTYNDMYNRGMDEGKDATLSKAAAEFSFAGGEHFGVVSAHTGANVKDGRDVEEWVKIYNELGRKPVIIVDFLQIMNTGMVGNEKQMVDKNMKSLKNIALNYNIPVLAISSLNRVSYLNEVSFESFKETGGIETWADVVIGMHLYVPERKQARWSRPNAMGLEEKKRILDDAKKSTPRLIEVKTLKNRTHEFGGSAYFEYYPKYDNFVETSEPLKETEDESNGNGTLQ